MATEWNNNIDDGIYQIVAGRRHPAVKALSSILLHQPWYPTGLPENWELGFLCFSGSIPLKVNGSS